MPLMLFEIIRNLNIISKSQLLYLTMALLLMQILISIKLGNQTKDVIKLSVISISILAFVSISCIVFINNYISSTHFRFIIIFSGIAAISTIALEYNNHEIQRFYSVGVTDNPNTSSYIFGLLIIFIANSTLSNSNEKFNRIIVACLLTSLAVMVIFIIFTKSRTGFLATIASVFIILSRGNRSLFRSLLILPGIFLGTFLYSILVRPISLDESLLARFEIWKSALDYIAYSPWIGHGYQNDWSAYIPTKNTVYTHTHNSFLAILRDGGILLLTLFLMIVIRAIYIGIRDLNNNSYLSLALVLFSLICISFDIDTVICHPNIVWFVFWIPISYCMSRELIYN